MAEWTRVGAGGAVVMGSNLFQSMNFLFISALKKFQVFGGLVTGTLSANFPVCRHSLHLRT